MSLIESGIEYRQLEGVMMATRRVHLKKRADLPALLAETNRRIPSEIISGPPFSIVNFISGLSQGLLIDIGYPVNQAFKQDDIQTRKWEEIEVLSLIHQGPLGALGESYGKLYGAAQPHAIISDEYAREVYLDLSDPENCRVELQFVIHNWTELLAQNTLRVLGRRASQQVMQGIEFMDIETTVKERSAWTMAAIKRLDKLADQSQKYEILSRCSHVFPQEQIERMRMVYRNCFDQTGDLYQSVDAVIAFIKEDPVWGVEPNRQGAVIYVAKNPRDRQAYAQATTQAERRQASCYCPLLRDNLDQGMPDCYCYCGAGWERQQWEGAIGQPLHVEVVQSAARGDDRCQFAIHLPQIGER